MKTTFLLVATLCAVAALITFLSMNRPAQAKDAEFLPDEVTVRLADADGNPGPPTTVPTIKKSAEEWSKELAPDVYRVLRREGTEPPFSCALLKNSGEGIYHCAGCDLPLFTSKAKFDSGTGWPSYYEPFAAENISEDRDVSLGMVRTEVHCPRCGGHLGHVFPDGPPPTRLRYCINGVSLTFRPAGS